MVTYGLLAIILLLSGLFPYHEALPNYPYSFPRDHFEHPDYRTEWWYYTGNLQDAQGRHYGFELVFFRQGARTATPTANQSAWRIDDLYLAHAAITKIDENQFHYAERLNRAGPGIAGASFAAKRIWNGNWQTQWTGDSQHLIALAEDFRLDLQLQPTKPFVIHGLNGVSQKAEGAGRASHYVSFPRLKVSGTLDSEAVHGEAWMDHEWFTEQLDKAQSGWDWFSAQFNDGTELMLFDLRRKDGKPDAYSAGTFIDRAGHPHHLSASDFLLRPTAYWKRYPIEWKIAIPSLKVNVVCKAALEKQELQTKAGATTYWEGAVTYSGTHQGRGYLEMTGYEKPISF